MTREEFERADTVDVFPVLTQADLDNIVAQRQQKERRAWVRASWSAAAVLGLVTGTLVGYHVVALLRDLEPYMLAGRYTMT